MRYLGSSIGGRRDGLSFFVQSNLAEFVHASWKNRDKMGVTLLESCMFYIRDSLRLEAEIQNFEEGSCMEQLQKIKGFWRQQKKLEKKVIKHAV